MIRTLEGRVALVTGAASGIGRASAIRLAAEGAFTYITDVNTDVGPALADELQSLGLGATFIEHDVSAEGDWNQVSDAIEREFGLLDILVNNAGVTTLKSIIDTPPDDWDWVNNVNLRAPYLLAQALVPGMIRQRRGKVINISSQSGVVALDDHGAYGASKGGLNMLTRVMAVEWAKHNVQSNSVCPTVILTPMGEMVWGDPAKGDPMKAKIPAGRFGRTTEVADLILFLASSASDMICGQTILLDGGFTAQ